MVTNWSGPPYLSQDPQHVKRRFHVREELRRRLREGDTFLRRKLALLPPDDPLRLRIQRDELTVQLQERAPRADTLLARRLTELVTAQKQRFQKQEGLAGACNSAYDAAFRGGSLDIPLLVEYEHSQRLVLALHLASDFLLQLGASPNSLRLHILAMELKVVLDADDTNLDMLDPMRAHIRDARPPNQAEQIEGCRVCGYQVLAGRDANGIRFAVHDDGAFVAVWPDGERMDLDLSLIAGSLEQLPDPQQFAVAVVGQNKDYPNYIYTDRTGHERELQYVATMHRYQFL